MVAKLLISFAGLVALFFVMLYPGQVLELLQLIVDAAARLAKGLSNLDVPNRNS